MLCSFCKNLFSCAKLFKTFFKNMVHFGPFHFSLCFFVCECLQCLWFSAFDTYRMLKYRGFCFEKMGLP